MRLSIDGKLFEHILFKFQGCTMQINKRFYKMYTVLLTEVNYWHNQRFNHFVINDFDYIPY